MLAQQFRTRVDERHHVLQLIAEAEGAARLVKTAARENAAGECLVEQPAIGKDVDRRIRCFDLHSSQRFGPVSVHGSARIARCFAAAQALRQRLRVVAIAAGAKAEDDRPRFSIRQI